MAKKEDKKEEVSQIQTLLSGHGKEIDNIQVRIGPRFLKLFSEQLYSSPNKAFEELVSNSWDAGAESVYIGVPKDLESESTAVWVLDNGSSMDLDGLQILWNVATSNKRENPPNNGRKQIGKFGIGKLATYLLANQLTYLCKSHDGVIRAVVMDYRLIDEEGGDKLHIEPVDLKVVQLSEEELKVIVQKKIPEGKKILQLIKSGVPKKQVKEEIEDEYGGNKIELLSSKNTWTLAILTSLKDAGKNMQVGWIRRLLRTALPLGSTISIVFNDETLTSAKIQTPVEESWIVGPELGIEEIEVDGRTHEILSYTDPYPRLEIEGIDGGITGKITLYKEAVTGGKSERVGRSNGFFVNILGRVLNPEDPYFGLENLSHSAWAKFRATLRADFLDSEISVTREDLKKEQTLKVFKALLMAIFNKVRTKHNSLERSSWPDAGKILTDAWNVVPIGALNSAINERLGGEEPLPEFLSMKDGVDIPETKREWQEVYEENPGELIKTVEYESRSPLEHLVRYDISGRRILINKNHPFVLENSSTNEEQLIVRDAAISELLSDAYSLSEVGLQTHQLEEIRMFRDQILRLISQVKRKSGAQIASLLLDATSHAKALEEITGDALDFLGFAVHRLGQSGEPEGFADAPLALGADKRDIAEKRSYRFTFDAKSTESDKVKTQNLGAAGLVRHRDNYDADHILVIAPDYQVADALLKECKKQRICPMRAKSLAKLIYATVLSGPLDLLNFKEVLELTNPNDVDDWISDKYLEATGKIKTTVSIPMLIDVLGDIGFQGSNAISISVIADRIEQKMGQGEGPKEHDVRNLVLGLQVMIPHLVRLTPQDQLFLSTSPEKIGEAISKQLNSLPPEYQKVIKNRLEGGLVAGNKN